MLVFFTHSLIKTWRGELGVRMFNFIMWWPLEDETLPCVQCLDEEEMRRNP